MNLGGEVRVALGTIESTLQQLREQQGVAPGDDSPTSILIRSGAACVLKTLQTAGHDIGPEGELFLRDHVDAIVALRARRTTRDTRRAP